MEGMCSIIFFSERYPVDREESSRLQLKRFLDRSMRRDVLDIRKYLSFIWCLVFGSHLDILGPIIDYFKLAS